MKTGESITVASPEPLADHQISMRHMGLNAFTLAFSPELEGAFYETYFARSLRPLRFYLLLAAAFFAIFGVLDYVVAPEIKGQLWLIRFGWICPGVLAPVALSYSRIFKKYMQPVLMLSVFWAGLGIVFMVAIAPPPVSNSYYAGLILVFIYGYTFMRVRFVYATAAGWMIVLSYEVVAVCIINLPMDIFISNNFFFISANIIGMLSSYSFEYYARKDFYLNRLLNQEREKVKAANLELEKRVEERTVQLLQANIDLKQEMTERKRAERELIQVHKMEAIGTLAGGIAHDFNNILMAIMGYAEIGLHKKNIGIEKVSYIFQQILQAGDRARGLVKQILTFSRRQEQEKIPVRVGSIVKEALKLMEATLPKNIEIRRAIMSEADVVLADPTHIHQIIMNLCTNAAQAMKEHGGVLEVTIRNVIRGEADAGAVEELAAVTFLQLSVRDTGSGIDNAIVDRIFDPFFSTKVPGEGTGMGLSVVHGIVKGCGGKITVEAEVGQGACFHVYLPTVTAETLDAFDSDHTLPAGGEHILLVDDEQALVDVGQEMLGEFGYTVTVHTDPLKALDAFCRNPQQFDLVITDKSMPGMSGFDLAREIFRVRPCIPVILCSGFNDAADIEKAKAIGFREMVMKPLIMREVAQTIRAVLDQKN